MSSIPYDNGIAVFDPYHIGGEEWQWSNVQTDADWNEAARQVHKGWPARSATGATTGLNGTASSTKGATLFGHTVSIPAGGIASADLAGISLSSASCALLATGPRHW
ncbi:hypothetical protein [Verrucomicrobium spinosum]|uniref:hypothetical protein n=1 Tax=Verrucomicrobium spinosum TaxID=2736 RepID=UPI0012E25FDF|nr:hypothetical protein [Verrucomicrobium spinosum]